MPLQQAMDVAIEKDLDLVKIAPGSNPPVCKIMDYGKFRFEQAKKDKLGRSISAKACLRCASSGKKPSSLLTF